jgi:hypothetical protein
MRFEITLSDQYGAAQVQVANEDELAKALASVGNALEVGDTFAIHRMRDDGARYMVDSSTADLYATVALAARMNRQESTGRYYAGYGMGQWHVYADTVPKPH